MEIKKRCRDCGGKILWYDLAMNRDRHGDDWVCKNEFKRLLLIHSPQVFQINYINDIC